MRKNNANILIGRIRRKVNRYIETEMKARGLDGIVVSQGGILGVLYRHQGKLSMKEIADLIRRDKSTVTYLVNKLTDVGYVAKIPDEKDSRVINVCLTDKAYEVEHVFTAISEGMLQRLYHNLTDKEAEQLEMLLEKVNENFDKLDN
ncbi:MAG: MarR family winged helix-turn-helix transcriptional regulator [Acidobacteriota bacterium]